LSNLVKAVNFSVKVFKVASIINSSVQTSQIGDPCPDCPTGRMADVVTLDEVIVTGKKNQYTDWDYRAMMNAVDMGVEAGRTVDDLEKGLKEGHASERVMNMFYEASTDGAIGYRKRLQDITDRQFEIEGWIAWRVRDILEIAAGEKILNSGWRALKWAAKTRAAKRAGKLFRNVDDLISGAGKLKRLKGGVRQGRVEGNIDDIFNSITKGGKEVGPGRIKLPDGTIVTKYPSATTGVPTIGIDKGGQLYKIRID
jgi:hypothetical protein